MDDQTYTYSTKNTLDHSISMIRVYWVLVYIQMHNLFGTKGNQQRFPNQIPMT